MREKFRLKVTYLKAQWQEDTASLRGLTIGWTFVGVKHCGAQKVQPEACLVRSEEKEGKGQ